MARKLAASGKATSNDRLKIFISYSRRDSGAADAIVAALTERGFDVAIDTRDLPFGEKWQAELAEFIRLSDTVIWLVSKDSIHSHWVNWELDEVARRNKRLVPLMVGLVNPAELPRQLGEIHILPPDRAFDLTRYLDTLVQVLETDRPWLKQASRLQDRAHEWLTKSRASALLLSRGALADAERWKDRRPAKAPAPAQEVMDLLLASRQAANRWQRRVLGGSMALTFGAFALAGFAYWQRGVAVLQTKVAEEQRTEAVTQRNVAEAQRRVTDDVRQQAQSTESGLLSRSASQLYDHQSVRDPGTAMLLALEGLPDTASDDPVTQTRKGAPEAEVQLDGALRAVWERATLAGHTQGVNSAAFSPDGSRIVTASWDTTARLWADDGTPLATLVGHTNRVFLATFSADGSRIVTASGDGTARLWAADGKALATLVGHTREVASAAFNPDGSRIVTASGDGTARLWATDGTLVASLAGHADAVASATFSPDGSRILTVSDDNMARLWAADGTTVATLAGHCPKDKNFGLLRCSVTSAAFSPDGSRIVTASGDGTARLWSADGTLVATLAGHTYAVTSAVFSPDGSRIVTASGDRTARLWAEDGNLLATLEGHTGWVASASFNPLPPGADGTAHILTASFDGTARIWRVFMTIQALVNTTKARAPRCLTQEQRKAYFLRPAPPTWCVERRLWPYHGAEWQQWLPKRKAWLAAGRTDGQEPPLPNAE